MTGHSSITITPRRRVAAWLVHGLTASGAVFGLLTLDAIHQQHFLAALWFMSAAIVVDAVDGFLARRALTSLAAPRVDGALLDNIVDYLNYVITPAFFMIENHLLPWGFRFLGASAVAIASAYQFTQFDAKTEDHFFKGFPSYWNITVFYLYIWNTSEWLNMMVILILCAMVFVPIKYIYPSRMNNLSRWIRAIMFTGVVLWGFSSAGILLIYPRKSKFLMAISFGYVIVYITVSVIYTLFRARQGRRD